ncbi:MULTISPECIES: FtsW/RodA/SpoVE family cell cycle protein [Prochlorococcus]|uniref:Probable peptidoglycan glycosyltransferase FtsW n=1 Tax=Prochlorococcus marinus (strain SARG / CCMP1375 / SS120) TaxID=167539 RepID=Q7VA56_PROMA|nr:Bacterial cell division membrane protein [Prochlorococcus marinus subsp. marinus str. CCMP1375]KGG10850.1 Cell division protein FtsW [Prochlorococcus marinus str. LG]KGG20430.1 Cell division protein FtsW [Prochlorococcus marinus str. SS2]KGG24099.1 Cell division protein FtsW [Prochlorococcus marinus str. SS35]KGG31644.1 Cell division protein FtsW [Prochlorococcus marinus str. SS51]KGG34710.1 Cell division protein FtsW [Prochlorococcus sp. SS52]
MRSPTIKRIDRGALSRKISQDYLARKVDIIPFWQRFIPLQWELWPSEARLLLALMIFWSVSGLFILGSASWWVASKEMGDGAYFIKRQMIWLLTSWGFAWLTISISLRKWLKMSKSCLLICLLLVGATLVFGSNINGSSRWLIIGSITIQPSELVKPFLILQAANLFGQWERLNNGKKFLELSLFGTLILLILKQPNLSTAALIGILIWMMALSAGVSLKNLFSAAFLGISIGTFSIATNQYQLLRVTSFLNPWDDPQGNGYQLIQSLLAIGSGGLFGEGYGLSTQKLLYLPFLNTDFVFAVFAEEFGFAGSFMLIMFFILIAFLGLRISLRSRNNYSKLIAIGCSTMLIGQSIFHLAVTSGSMPTTGLPLPFISYGGNSLLSSFIIGSLLVRCSLESTGFIGGIKVQKKLN